MAMAGFKQVSSPGWRVLLAIAALGAGACSEETAPAGPVDGGPDSAGVPDAGPGAGGPAVSGTVRDKGGVVVSGARVELGSASVFSDTQGKYTLAGLPLGAGTLKVTRDWFKPLEQSVTVAAAPATLDLTLEEVPLKLEPADQALAEGYNRTFDWTRGTLSIAIAARPTRRDFDNAVFFRNPALYRDTSAEAPLTPAPMPAISAGAPQNFSFPIRAGARMGQEALEIASIADAVGGTTLGAQEPEAFMMWTPMVNWLSERDPARAADLRAVATAIRQQNWGGNAIRPQDLDKVFLDPTTSALWVKVVFAPFVQLGAGISDDDLDGAKEIYARIASAHLTAAVVDSLRDDYGKTVFNTHGLSKEVAKSLNELYSSTAAQVERYIGQPFEVPGVGTIMYPFVVLRHTGGQKNVILIAPGP